VIRRRAQKDRSKEANSSGPKLMPARAHIFSARAKMSRVERKSSLGQERRRERTRGERREGRERER
jgi:hypothetical protein